MKLNLGCGNNQIAGWVNVDKFANCNPDIVVDLEHFPFPWEDNSVDEILLSHVLEHLGQLTDVYLKIIQELYRICRHGAIIKIDVPHPYHENFISDPTHVRPITVEGLKLFDQTLNQEWINEGFSNTPLGIYLGVNFKITNAKYIIDEKHHDILKSEGELIFELMRKQLNVCKQISIELVCIKA
jgi:SAM-dependent methyltransferase